MKFDGKEYRDVGFIAGNSSRFPKKSEIDAFKSRIKKRKQKKYKGKKVSIRTSKHQDPDGKRTKYVTVWLRVE